MKDAYTWLVAIAILLLAYGFTGGSFSGSQNQEEVSNQQMTNLQCPSTGYTALGVRVNNNLATGAVEYMNTTAYAIPNNGDAPTSITTKDDGTFVTGNIDCLDINNSYKVVIVADDVPGENSGEKTIGKVSGYSKNVDMSVAKAAELEIKIHDEDADAWLNETTDGTNNAWHDFPVLTFAAIAGTRAIGADGEINDVAYVRDTSASAQYGDIKTYIAVDAATSVWQEPSISVGGVQLRDVKDTLSSNDLLGVSDYEYVFKLPGPITHSTTAIAYTIQTVGGVNPGASDDPKFLIITKTRMLSNDGVTLIEGIYKDDASRTIGFTAQDWTDDVS